MKKSELLSLAIEASLMAGERIMEIYKTDDFNVDFKADNSPLTKADVASHNIIEACLKKSGIPILSEEGKELPYAERKNWDVLWIVDPIDGTKEFIKKNGEFTVNIALIENGVPQIGVIYVPAQGTLYYSDSENGAFKIECVDTDNSIHFIQTNASQIPLKRETSIYTIVASRSHLSSETEDFIESLKKKHGTVELISKGSSLKLCMVAEGSADCYPRFAPTMEWDTAAGQAICMHAGFDVIDWETQETMKYNRENLLNNWFLVR